MCVCTGLRNYASRRKRILAANGGAGRSLDRRVGEVGIRPNERATGEPVGVVAGGRGGLFCQQLLQGGGFEVLHHARWWR